LLSLLNDISTKFCSTSSGIHLRCAEEIERIQASNQIVVETLNLLRLHIKPGISTLELDEIAEKRIRDHKASPAFKGYRGFPASICTSINHELVHGIPSKKRILKEGDILTIDCGCSLDGYYGDAAVTYAVGEVGAPVSKLLETTKRCLLSAVDKARVGFRLYDISAVIQTIAEGAGFNVVREYTGHGIGTKMHEPPLIPNYGTAGMGPRLKAGMVFALEPMLIEGDFAVEVSSDGWTVYPRDRSLTAHFEHTVAITEQGPQVLSAGIIWD